MERNQHFNGALTTINVPIPPGDSGDLVGFFTNSRTRLRTTVESAFQDQQVRQPASKVYADLHLRLIREVPNEEPQYRDVYLRSHMQVITIDQSNEYIQELGEYFINRFENDLSEEEGSGFTLAEIVSLKLTFSLIMLNSRIGEYVPYPKGVPGKTHIINPSGTTDCVFQVLAGYKILKSGKTVPSGRQWESTCQSMINTGGIQSPVTWEDLGRLERLNKLCIRIYQLDNVRDRKGELFFY